MKAGGTGIYLRWGGRRNRADDLAEALGLELVSLSWRSGSIFIVPFRYVVQFLQTLFLLFTRSPNVVFSQHTQPFCSLAAVLYGGVTGRPVITDCHNGPFVDRLWQKWPLSWLNRVVYRNADINLVHNGHILNYIVDEQRLPGKFCVLRDPIPDFIIPASPPTRRPTVVAICSFAADEPVEALIRATRLTPEIDYAITGNVARLDDRLHAMAGENLHFTGFIPNAEYDRLLCGAGAAIALSTRENVLMRACHEAIGAGLPFVTTDIQVGREYLTGGTVFVDNTAESIAAGIRRAIEQRDRLAREMPALKRLRQGEWSERVAELRRRFGIDRD